MKTNKFILAGLMAVGCFFAACTEETPEYTPAQPETNEVQAYIYSNTPTSVQLTELGGKFPVVIGRNTTNATSFEVMHDDTLGLFTLDTEVSFAEGQKADTLWIQANYNYGETNTITLNIPEEYTTAYGPKTITMAVLVDYTWVPMGKVNFTSNFVGATGVTLAIEQAKEYSDANGNLLFRLNSPYYYATGAQWCTKPGYHLQFLLDKDYNAVDMLEYGFIQMLDNGPYFEDGTAPINYAYYDPINYGSYCFFVSQGNVYQLGILFSDKSGLTLGGEIWQWVEGYPGAAAE